MSYHLEEGCHEGKLIDQSKRFTSKSSMYREYKLSHKIEDGIRLIVLKNDLR